MDMLTVDTSYTGNESSGDTDMGEPLSPDEEPNWTEIDFDQLEFHEVLGRGAYGFVQKAVWNNKNVAVKLIQSEMERNAFKIEVRQLSRVRHENIVELYGACTVNKVALVMEFAEGGSLYYVLHNQPDIHYTAAHAISWALQCARGVEYLHNLKPKPLVHRDLKPPNLLLVEAGRRLKICDFGTACDLQTYMTNNKGSAAWMAPEVFQGSLYNEKCDVFSWGIILWEVLTRRKPFEDVGQGPNAAFRIMWAVHTGIRPPLITGCPKALDFLMIECWAREAELRPSMSNIVTRLSCLAQFFDGADVPLGEVPAPQIIFDDSYANATLAASNFMEDTLTTGTPVPLPLKTRLTPTPIVKEESYTSSMSSAPPSISSSYADLLSSNTSEMKDKLTSMSPPGHGQTKRGHRRGGSYDTALLTKDSKNGEKTTPEYIDAAASTAHRDKLHLSLVKDYERTHSDTNTASCSSADESPQVKPSLAYKCLEPHLQPLQPIPGVEESLFLYRKHCEGLLQQAALLLQRQEEVAILSQRKRELLEQMSADIKEQHTSERLQEEYNELLAEGNKLREIQTGLSRELEMARCKRRT